MKRIALRLLLVGVVVGVPVVLAFLFLRGTASNAACRALLFRDGVMIDAVNGLPIDEARRVVREQHECISLRVRSQQPCTDVGEGFVLRPVGRQWTDKSRIDVVVSRVPRLREDAMQCFPQTLGGRGTKSPDRPRP